MSIDYLTFPHEGWWSKDQKTVFLYSLCKFYEKELDVHAGNLHQVYIRLYTYGTITGESTLKNTLFIFGQLWVSILVLWEIQYYFFRTNTFASLKLNSRFGWRSRGQTRIQYQKPCLHAKLAFRFVPLNVISCTPRVDLYDSIQSEADKIMHTNALEHSKRALLSRRNNGTNTCRTYRNEIHKIRLPR